MLKAEPNGALSGVERGAQAVDLIYPEAHGERSLSA